MALPTRYPPADWRPVVNTSGQMVQPTRGLIPHVQQGNGSLHGMFNTPSTQVSSHLWLSKAGGWEQYLDFTQRAWAEAAGNPYWISVECEGYDTEDYTPAQLQRLGELYAWGVGAFGWPLAVTDDPNGRGLGTHRMGGAAWGGHSCPGNIRANRRPAILAAARAVLNGGDMPLTDDEINRIGAAAAAAVWNAKPPDLGGANPPILQPSMAFVVGQTYNKAGAIQAPLLADLANQVGLVGVAVAQLRAELQTRAANGTDLTGITTRLDSLEARVAGLKFIVDPSTGGA